MTLFRNKLLNEANPFRDMLGDFIPRFFQGTGINHADPSQSEFRGEEFFREKAARLLRSTSTPSTDNTESSCDKLTLRALNALGIVAEAIKTFLSPYKFLLGRSSDDLKEFVSKEVDRVVALIQEADKANFNEKGFKLFRSDGHRVPTQDRFVLRKGDKTVLDFTISEYGSSNPQIIFVNFNAEEQMPGDNCMNRKLSFNLRSNGLATNYSDQPEKQLRLGVDDSMSFDYLEAMARLTKAVTESNLMQTAIDRFSGHK